LLRSRRTATSRRQLLRRAALIACSELPPPAAICYKKMLRLYFKSQQPIQEFGVKTVSGGTHHMATEAKLSAYERKSLERRIDELRERLQTLLDRRLPREELVQHWQIVLDEMSDINDKLGNDE
jgi:hypothetical protein